VTAAEPLARQAPVQVGGPWFEDLRLGQVFEEAPGMTVTSGHAALHQALAGDRLYLALDAPLCRAVSGRDAPLVHPNLVCDVAIGQSTGPTQRVRGNLFYRGLVLARPVFVGDTLRTRTEVVGLKQNRRREGVPTTGLVALRMTTVDQLSRPVLDFWRCPMLPLREPNAVTGHADDFEDIPQVLTPSAVERAVPASWDLEPLRDAAPGPHHAELVPGSAFAVEGGETVTGAPELAQLMLKRGDGAHPTPRAPLTGAGSSTAGTPSRSPLPTPPGRSPRSRRSSPGMAAITWGRCLRATCFVPSCVWRAPRRWARAAARRGCALLCQRSGAPASGRSCSTGDSWPSWPRKEAE
jgi:acyl dehydratase